MANHINVSNNWLHDKTILLAKTEPLATEYPPLVSVCILPLEEYFGLGKFEPIIKPSSDGTCTEVVHSLQTFTTELLNGSFTEVDLLLKEDNFLVKTEFGQELLDNRHLFLTADIYRKYISLIKQYSSMLKNVHYDGYSKWKGYNLAYVSNIARWYKNAYTILTNGKTLPNIEMLAKIKKGRCKLLEILQQFTTWNLQLQLLELDSSLQEEIDMGEVSSFIVNLTKKYYKI